MVANLTPNDKLNIGVIGAGGAGVYSVAGLADENIAALCDVHEGRLGEMASRHPQAKAFPNHAPGFWSPGAADLHDQ